MVIIIYWSVAASAVVAFYLFLLHFDFVGIQRSHVLSIVTRTNDNNSIRMMCGVLKMRYYYRDQ